MLKTVSGESPGKETTHIKSSKSKQCWSAFATSVVSSTLNLTQKGTLVIRHSTWRCWKGLLMPWGASEESSGENAHRFFTTRRRQILRFECRSL
jgi:hypothetical protein